MKISRLFLLSPLVLLAACGSLPPYQPLSSDARDKIASTDVIVPIRQHEIYVFVPASTAGASAGASMGLAGAIVGALVDASVDSVRTGKAEKAVTPLRDSLVDYSFDTTFKDDLTNSLSQLSWVHVDTVHVVRDFRESDLDNDLAGSKDAAVLLMTTDYSLDNDGNVLTVTVGAALYPNNEALRAFVKKGTAKPSTALGNSIYHDTLVFRRPLDGATADRDANIAKWSADKGAMMREALDDAAKRLAQKIAADLQRNDADGPPNAGDGLPTAAP